MGRSTRVGSAVLLAAAFGSAGRDVNPTFSGIQRDIFEAPDATARPSGQIAVIRRWIELGARND